MLAIYSSRTSDALHILASSSRNRKVVHSMLCGTNHLSISTILRYPFASDGFTYTSCWWVVILILQFGFTFNFIVFSIAVLFYSSSLYLVSGSLVLTVVVMNVARRASTIPAPWILRVTLQGLPGRLLCLGLAESGGCLKVFFLFLLFF